jgi:cysteinyl-tRNA synthetase
MSSSTAFPEIVLYNSKSRSKEPLETLEEGQVKMYTCGPTVYDSAHVGNFRAFLTYDVLKRALQYFGWNVDHVCNLTDVDDKILMRCERESINVEELTLKYEQAFMDDLDALNIIPARAYPRATQHIDDMVELIQMLSDNDLAYQTGDGSWYYATANDDKYGTQLINLNVEEMESQDRTSTEDDMGKRNGQDFCLWKAFKEGIDREDATWTTPIGRGRPGWHIECSAMARVFLGDSIDIHCGGIDLKFPHHENEIAQSEGATGKTFCNCWIHNGFVNIDNEKMSKSKGNFLTLRTACGKADEVRAYRYLVVSSQYRNPLNFTEQAVKAAQKALKRLDKVRALLIETLSKEGGVVEGESNIASTLVPTQMKNFELALLDDLSMPRAAASLFALIKAAEAEFKNDSDKLDIVGLHAINEAMTEMDKVFGVFYQVPLSDEEEQEQKDALIVPEDVLDLVGQRTVAKDAKDWDLADSLRQRITELGFKVKDVKDGEPIVSRLES